MRNKLLILFVTVLLMLCFSGCSIPTSSVDSGNANAVNTENIEAGKTVEPVLVPILDVDKMRPEIAAIIDRGELVVAIPSEDIPVFFEEDEDGELKGIEITLAKGLAASLGVEVVFERSAKSHDELTDKLLSGEADVVIATYSNSLERAKKALLSEPYLDVDYGVMANRQALLEYEAEDNPVPILKKGNVKIGAVKGTSHLEMAAILFPGCEIIELESYAAGAKAAAEGEIFGFFCSEFQFILEYGEDPSLSIYTKTFTFQDVQDSFCVGVAPGNEGLMDYINIYIKKNKNTFSKNEILAGFLKLFEGDNE